MRASRATLATVASAAVVLLCACGGPTTVVDRTNSQSLYLLVDAQQDVLYEYGPGDEHPRSARLVSESSDPWMDASGNLYLRRSLEGIFRYDASSWARHQVYRGDDDNFVVDPKGTLYLALMGGVETIRPGSPPLRIKTASAAWQMIVVDARGRTYAATMPD
jgi:hypothetical protein